MRTVNWSMRTMPSWPRRGEGPGQRSGKPSTQTVVRLPATLQSRGNIGRLVEHANDGRRLRFAVGDPIPPRLDPNPTRQRQRWIGSGRRQTARRVGFDFPFSLRQCGEQAPNGFGPILVLVIPAEVINLSLRFRRVGNQRRLVSVGAVAPARFASSRAIVSRSRCMIGSDGTVFPAASSASLSARASSQPGGAGGNGSSITVG